MEKRFVKLARDFGIRLDGNKEAKKNSVYGRDDLSLFYCDRFPKNYQGKNPKLKIYRFLYQPSDGMMKKAGAAWVLKEECNDTTRNIWRVYCENGRQEVLNRFDMNFKRNNDITKYLNQNPCGSTKNKYTSVSRDYYKMGWFRLD